MAGYSEAVDCPRCGGEESLETSWESHDNSGEGTCLECGYTFNTGVGTIETVMTLEEANNERKEFDMEPLTELKSPVEGWKGDSIGLVAEHQYDCKGNHRVVVDGEVGDSSMYDSAAFTTKDGKWYMSVTQYYEGTIPHEMCEGVYELVPVNRKDASVVTAYNLFRPDEVCPHLENTDVVCPGITEGRCPQRKKEDDTDKDTRKDED